MSDLFFADTASIELQDEQTLELLSADYSYAQFELTGFTHLQVFVTDHRADSVLAFHACQADGDPTQFARQFNSPAYVLVSQTGERAIMIDLYTPTQGLPIHTLWIGKQRKDSLPIHQYHFYHTEPASSGYLSFLAMYQNDPEPFPVLERVPVRLAS